MSYLKIDKYGTKCWYNDKGEYHREGGPAIELNYDKYWFINGKSHREDGPARETPDGIEWWYNGKFIGYSEDGFTQEDFERWLRIKEYW